MWSDDDGVIDPATGEIIQVVDNKKKHKKRIEKKPNAFSNGWLSVSQTFTASLVDMPLYGSEMRVLLVIFSLLGYHNNIIPSQADIGAMVGMRRQRVNAIIGKFKRLGIIEIYTPPGQQRTLRVNPDFAWRGSGRSHQITIWQRDQDAKRAARVAREADNVARLRLARMRFVEHHPQPSTRLPKSGYRGVTAHNGRWQAQVSVHGHRLTVGTYDTPEAAHDAYLAAKRELQIHKPADK